MSSGSLASATSSRVDSASKHIQACRVSTEFLLSTLDGVVDNPTAELQSNKMKYCMHKDEVVVGLGRPRYRVSMINSRKKAYPSVITNMGQMSKEALRWMAMHNFLAVDGYWMTEFKDRFIKYVQDPANAHALTSFPTALDKKFHDQINNMMEMYFVGISLGMAYAHPNSGDTVASVMIGGLRTVMNGHFPIHTNDLIMFYFDEERDLFHESGGRIDRNSFKFVTAPGNDAGNVQQALRFIQDGPVALAAANKSTFQLDAKEQLRQKFTDRANGNFGSKQDQKMHIFYIKPYVVSSHKEQDDLITPQYFPCDKARIIGRAISNAQPFEMVDIQLSRQAI